MTVQEFIEKAKKVHGDKYDYSKVEYVNNKTKVCIVCPEHGEFWQTPDSHLRGRGCRQCSIKSMKDKQRLSTKDFIEKAKEIHGDKYDYSKVEYVNSQTKVCIICPKHGEFWQTPLNHLKGKGCPDCYGNKKLTYGIFIEKAKKVHGDKYDYSKVVYKNVDKKVCIICPEHGEFWQTPYKHITRKQGCPICGGRTRLNKDIFIEKARKVHGNKYDYSKVDYINNSTKVCIICPEHGEFWQTPNKHFGKQMQGCPHCASSIIEKKCNSFFTDNNILFEQHKKFGWLGQQHLDFYIPEYNFAIECQGEQHYKPVDFANKGEEWAKMKFEQIKNNDKKKSILCEENNVKLYYIKYNENVVEKLNKILKNYERL